MTMDFLGLNEKATPSAMKAQQAAVVDSQTPIEVLTTKGAGPKS